MSDTLMSIIGIMLAVILMFIFPLMVLAGNNDEIAQTIVEIAVSDFVNQVATKGKITRNDYNALIQKLGATGNTYDIQIEVKILDDNPRRVTTTSNPNLSGEYKYYSVYTSTIMYDVNRNSEFLLKNDDYIIVTAKSTNQTMGTLLKNFIYKVIGKGAATIGTSATAVILNAGN